MKSNRIERDRWLHSMQQLSTAPAPSARDIIFCYPVVLLRVQGGILLQQCAEWRARTGLPVQCMRAQDDTDPTPPRGVVQSPITQACFRRFLVCVGERRNRQRPGCPPCNSSYECSEVRSEVGLSSLCSRHPHQAISKSYFSQD
jgi:hypothetical protein